MVTAILPSMIGSQSNDAHSKVANSLPSNVRVSVAASLDSGATITPANYNGRAKPANTTGRTKPETKQSSSPPRLAGLVGVFTGCGALVALALFLPLPSQFSYVRGITQGQAVAYSFYVVGAISFLVACFCFFGLRNLHGEDGKGWNLLFGRSPSSQGYQVAPQSEDEEAWEMPRATFLPYWRLLLDSTVLGFKDAQIGLGYLGGFVARASSVGISLFIPLYVNAYFMKNGFCKGSPNDPSPDLKKECRAAYVLAAELTGVSQLIALLCAPLFGYLSDRYRRFNIPLLAASVCGIIGYTTFGRLTSPEPKDVNGRGGSPIVFLYVALIGISQIGAIVCSLGLLGRGVLGAEGGYNLSSQLESASARAEGVDTCGDTAALLSPAISPTLSSSRRHLKGSIAGVYSLSGGAAILILTKVGGLLFDSDPGAPFYLMSGFNAILLVVGIGAGMYRELATREQSS